jgi:hypothetical protein
MPRIKALSIAGTGRVSRADIKIGIQLPNVSRGPIGIAESEADYQKHSYNR